jgi:hypothetical protein
MTYSFSQNRWDVMCVRFFLWNERAERGGVRPPVLGRLIGIHRVAYAAPLIFPILTEKTEHNLGKILRLLLSPVDILENGGMMESLLSEHFRKNRIAKGL